MLLVMELLRQKGAPESTVAIAGTDSGSALILNKATSYIAANIHEPLRVSQVSHVCSVSESCLYKIFSAALGMSPKEYILNCKAEYAAVTQVARELGFSNPNHFSNAFYKIMGVRPSEYRKN